MVRLSAFADEAGATLREQIAALEKNGISNIDLRAVEGVNVMNFTPEKAREYKALLDGAGIRVSCIGSPLGKSDPVDFDRFKPSLDKALDLCETFETDKIRIFSFYNFKGQERKITDCLGRAVERARERGVTLYHENELGIYGDSPADCVKIVKETGCGCIYDPANFILAGHDIAEAEELILPLSDFYHVKDARYRGEIVPAGAGDAGMEKLLSRDGITLTVEPHLFTFGGLSALTSHTFQSPDFVYPDAPAAFSAGASAVISILQKNGLKYY